MSETPKDPTGQEDFDHEAFVALLVRTAAMTTTKASPLNLITLLTSGLMTWRPDNRIPLNFEDAKIEAAGLVLEAVTGIMIQMSQLALDGNAPNK